MIDEEREREREGGKRWGCGERKKERERHFGWCVQIVGSYFFSFFVFFLMSRARRRPGLAAALAAALFAAALAATAASGAYGVSGAAAAAAAASSSSSASAARRGGDDSDSGGSGSFFLGSLFDERETGGEAETSPYIVELVAGSDDDDVTSLCERLEAGKVGGGGGGGGSGSGSVGNSTSSKTNSNNNFARCGRHLYRSVFFGALVHASPGTAAALEREPGVASVHPDDLVTLHSDENREGGKSRARLFLAASSSSSARSLRSASSSSSSSSCYPQTQLDAPWHLARLSSPEPLSKRKREGSSTSSSFSLEFSAAGTGVTIFVVDTGVLAGHDEFRWSTALAPLSSHSSSPASRVRRGFSVFDNGPSSSGASSSPSPSSPSSSEEADCVGHGTHVAALAAGLTFGLAKNATLVPVRVVGCDGAAAVSDVVAGLDWISSVLQSGSGGGGGGEAERGGGGENGDDDENGSNNSSPLLSSYYSLPAVVSLSVGSSRPSPALDRAAQALVDAGALVVAAAGNAGADACGASPGRLPSALTVGASDERDGVWPSSNFGPCVDLHAPGVNVTSATSMRSGGIEGEGGGEGGGGGVGPPSSASSTTNTAVASGTSMAAPVVSGAAAVFMEAWPGATPAEVHERIVSSAAKGVLRWGTEKDEGEGGGGGAAAAAALAAAAAAAATAEANTANLLLQSPPPPRPELVVSPSSLPHVILFEPAKGGEGEEETAGGKQRGVVARERLVLSLPPSSSSSLEQETPFEVKVDFFAGGAPAGWLSASPASGVLNRENPTATIELAFDASAAAAGFSSPSSSGSFSSSSSGALSADVVVTSRNKLAARRRASARVFCSRLALAPRGGARRVTGMDFLETWDEATGPPGKKKRWGGGGGGSQGSSSSSSSPSSPWVSATLAVALSHPVAANSLPEGSIVVNEGAGEVVSVVAKGGDLSCSEWVVRVRAPAASSSSSSSPSSSPAASSSSPPSARLCVSFSPRGVFDVWGAPFGAREGKAQLGNCTQVRLAPRLRLFAPFAAAAAPEVFSSSSSSSSSSSNSVASSPLLSVEAEVGASEDGRVLLLLAASEPVSGLDASSFDVAVTDGRRGQQRAEEERAAAAAVVALSPVVAAAAAAEKGKERAEKGKATATLWHAVLQLPAGYLGPVVVSLRTQGIRSYSAGMDGSGPPRDASASASAAVAAAPAAPLALRAVAAPLLRPAGFQLLF